MKRTQIRRSEELNTGKWNEIVRLVEAYADQKNRFLNDFAHIKFLRDIKSNQIRDTLVHENFASPCGLKARAWKMALNDALDTVDRYWKAVFEMVKKPVYRKFTDEQERHYAFWLLRNYAFIQYVMRSKVPNGQPKRTELSEERRLQIMKYLHRTLRKDAGKRPVVRMKRSMALDAEMYRVFEEGHRQYIAISKLNERGRTIIPLRGHQAINGNIRLILNRDSRIVEINVTNDLVPDPGPEEHVVGGDFGQTEVLATSEGNKYGITFGDDLKAYADMIDTKCRQRNKIHALERFIRATNPTKAKRIREHNLGKTKWKLRKMRMLGRIKTGVNTAINQFIKTERPSNFIHEDLTRYIPPFGKGRFSRLMSYWMRSILSDRIPFMLQAGGSGSQAVNPAYSSQTCPTCGYVDPRNRRGDRFQCQNPDCPDGGAVLDADTVGARNMKARKDDQEIHLWTPKENIREILVRRFEARRLERKAAYAADLTVPARTPEMTQFYDESVGERTQTEMDEKSINLGTATTFSLRDT